MQKVPEFPGLAGYGETSMSEKADGRLKWCMVPFLNEV